MRTEIKDLLAPMLAQYAALAESFLEQNGRPVGRVSVSPSPATWDGDCEGQLWARVVSILPILDGASSTMAAPCGVPFWQVNIGVGIIRCIHTVDNHGQAPSADEITADGFSQILDLQILKDAISYHENTRLFQSWNPLPPSGGFAGGEWLFNARLDNIVSELPSEEVAQ